MKLTIDGKDYLLSETVTVAAALALFSDGTSRESVHGHRRSPVCGMGVCQECRVTINGVRRLACQTLCSEGMQIVTNNVIQGEQ